jgi:hypothetical protein
MSESFSVSDNFWYILYAYQQQQHSDIRQHIPDSLDTVNKLGRKCIETLGTKLRIENIATGNIQLNVKTSVHHLFPVLN